MPVHILVIDDDENICFTIGAIGAYAGWLVKACADVDSGLRILRDFRADLILLDYHLPFQNGLAALPEIHRAAPDVPVVVLTVEEDQTLAEQFHRQGAADYALKPIKAPDLISRVNLNLEVARLKQKVQSSVKPYVEKGMNQETLDLLVAFARTRPSFFAIDEAAQALHLGYSTTHRYLSYLEQSGVLHVRYNYGKQGRPRKEYALVGKN